MPLEGRRPIRISIHRRTSIHSLVLLFLLPHGLFAQEPATSDSRLIIPDGTAVRLRLTHTVSSLRARVGDPLDFIVENDVKVGGSTVIRAKSPARGTVIGVKGKRCLGIAGEVAYQLDSVALVNGETVGLRGQGQVKGSYHIWRMVAGIAATGLFYMPAAPVFLLTRGGNSTLLKGTEITAQIDGETSLLSADAPSTGETIAGLNDMMENLQPRVMDGEGREGDMVNLIFVAQNDELQQAFKRAGWVKTDPWRPIMAWHLLLYRTHDVKLPMARFYLFGRKQDYSYALPDPNAIVSRRHHIRIWKTQYTVDGNPLWVGSASYDEGIQFAKHGRIINHTIDPEVDTERDFVGIDLAETSKVHEEYVHAENPVFQARTASGEAYHSDSRILLLDLHQAGVVTAALPGAEGGLTRSISTATPPSGAVLQSNLSSLGGGRPDPK